MTNLHDWTATTSCTGERVIPWSNSAPTLMVTHAMRYAWAMQHCINKRVVDLGCGTGYGSFMLSWVAQHVTGLDIDDNALDFAQQQFWAFNLLFGRADLNRPIAYQAEVYVALEVLEHLDDPVSLVQRIPGALIWSVPTIDDSKFHKHTYMPAQAAATFGGEIWYQDKVGCIVPQREWRNGFPQHVLGIREPAQAGSDHAFAGLAALANA